MVFFCDKKLVERWYLLVTENFLFWAFPWCEIRSSLRQRVYGKMIFTGYWKVLVLSFSVMRNTVMEIWYLLITEKFLFWAFWWREIQSFFIPKSWYKDNIYLVFLSFSWYSRTWEVRFFVQWFFYLHFLFLFVCVYFTVCVFMFYVPLHGQSQVIRPCF